VARIVPTVDRAKATVMTKIRFEALDPRVLPEMSAKAVFLSQAPGPGDEQPVTAVSPKTLAERDGGTVVFRIAGDTVQAVPVRRGRTLGDLVEINASTLQAGDRLVLEPSPQLATGAKVALSGGR
jgi:multidrug efflux pump subunit AcrA (membrane-fusion protein)